VTFNYVDPTDSRKDAMRFLTGDVDPAQPLLHDEEIEYMISLWTDKSDYYVASYCAEAIAGKFARHIDVSVDSQSLGASALQDKFLSLAARLRELDRVAFPGEIFMGGVDPGEGVFAGTLPLAFGTGMHDNPSAGGQDFGDTAFPADWREKWGMSDVP